VKTGTVARRGARVHQEYRQLPVFTGKPGRRGESPLGADSCAAMRLKTQTTSRTGIGEGLSQARNEFRHHDTRSVPALRVQCRYCAPARFWWLFFGD
jgi:hypothetical protein